jgi:murein L,D-transpeptidase YcbB/YkuD
MAEEKMVRENATSRRDLLPLISLVFSLFAFAVFLYVFFGNVAKEFRADAIYWFLIALAAAVLPQLKQIRFRDLEISLREEISKSREEVEQRVDNLQAFMSSINSVELSESALSQDQREHRDRVFRDFNRRLQGAEPEQRLGLQERFTRMHLAKLGISLSDVKTALAQLGLYKGNITNDFDNATARAIEHFQEMNGLEADGIFGLMSYQRLAAHLAQKSGD